MMLDLTPSPAQTYTDLFDHGGDGRNSKGLDEMVLNLDASLLLCHMHLHWMMPCS